MYYLSIALSALVSFSISLQRSVGVVSTRIATVNLPGYNHLEDHPANKGA